MAAAISEAAAEAAGAKTGDCSTSTSPQSTSRPAAVPARPAGGAAPRVGWGVPISGRDENRQPEEGLVSSPPQRQQQRQPPQAQRGHGLPVRAASCASGGSSGGGSSAGGAPRPSSGNSFRSGNSGSSFGQPPRQPPPREKTFAPGPALPGHAKSIGDAMAHWGAPAGRNGLDADSRPSREALQEVSMNDLFMGLWCAPGSHTLLSQTANSFWGARTEEEGT